MLEHEKSVFTDDKHFCLDVLPISSYVKHRGDSFIALHQVKSQMGVGDVMILGAISSFSNLMIKVFEGKYNNPKFLDDLQTTFILWYCRQFGQNK